MLFPVKVKLGVKMGICLTSMCTVNAYSNSVLDAKDSSKLPHHLGGFFYV